MPKRLKKLESPLKDAALKVKWADKDIQAADVIIHNFLFNKPYTFFKEMNGDGTQEIMKIRFISEVPDEAIRHISASLHHLRSALDALAWAVAHRFSPPRELEAIKFPVGKSREAFFNPGNQRKIAQLGTDWLDYINSLEPYQGGNDLLFALHATNIVDKHRSLSYLATAGGANIAIKGITLGDTVTVMGGLGSPLEDGTPICSFTPGNNPKIELPIYIAFGDFEITKGESVIASLKKFSHLVVRILEKANTRFF